MTMHQALAEFYGTNGVKTAAEQPAKEDLEKAAQYELFYKLAADNNVDLTKMNDEQINKLYAETFAKTAGEMPPQFAAHMKGKEEHKDEKKDHEEVEERAKKEHEEKKAAAAKFAEADFMGRVIAHAMVQESQKIAADLHKQATSTQAPGEWNVPLPKVASAIDTLAMHRAFAIVQEFNKTAAQKIDEKTAAEGIAQVHTNGLADSVKVASAADHSAAVEIRALETLEAVGFKINWNA